MTAQVAGKATNKPSTHNRRGPQAQSNRGAAPRNNGSKYAKKNKHQKPKVFRPKRGQPVFSYYVSGTDVRATKVPCEKDYEATATRPAQSHLGTWKDPRNGKKCKVDRVRNKPVDESTDDVQASLEA